MLQYPYTSPIILTNTLFDRYGGDIALANSVQLNVAYLMAEQAASNFLSTYLQPTTVTGTITAVQLLGRYIELPHSHINSITQVVYIDGRGTRFNTVTGTNTGDLHIQDAFSGIINVDWRRNCGGCGSYAPTTAEIVYTTGLSTLQASNPQTVMALVILAKEYLNEIVGYGNESPGAVGLKEFTSERYTEIRVDLIRTSLGTSNISQMAARLLEPLRPRKYLSLRL